MKLDRLLGKHESMGRQRAREAILGGRVTVDGCLVRQHDQDVTRFSQVELDGRCLGPPPRRLRVMLYKPCGVVSATVDKQWPTVVGLIDDVDRESLHLAGRLDRWSSGLVLLTNDGNWSKPLMNPEAKVPKVYEVRVRDPIPDEAVEAFARGFHFHTEDIVTRPVKLEVLGDCRARLTLHEGRYHQIKRMFHRIGNRVESLHRLSIGGLALPSDWQPGQWKLLDDEEAALAMLNRAPAAPHRPAPPDRPDQ